MSALPTSILRRENSVTVGLLTALGEYLIYNHALPSTADVRGVSPHNNDLETARQHAARNAAILLGVVSILSRDLNVLIIGGVALVGIDFMSKHANGVNPATGSLDASAGSQSVAPNVYSLPDYSDADAG